MLLVVEGLKALIFIQTCSVFILNLTMAIDIAVINTEWS